MRSDMSSFATLTADVAFLRLKPKHFRGEPYELSEKVSVLVRNSLC